MQSKTIEKSDNSYFISYAVKCNQSINRDETAIIIGEKYFILAGDHLDSYRDCGSKKKQLEYFLGRKNEIIRPWSNKPLEAEYILNETAE